MSFNFNVVPPASIVPSIVVAQPAAQAPVVMQVNTAPTFIIPGNQGIVNIVIHQNQSGTQTVIDSPKPLPPQMTQLLQIQNPEPKQVQQDTTSTEERTPLKKRKAYIEFNTATSAPDQEFIEKINSKPYPASVEIEKATVQAEKKSKNSSKAKKVDKAARQCLNTNCNTTETTLWRKGPEGKNTLCNACGIYWKRTGILKSW